MVTFPIHQFRCEEISDTLIAHVLSRYGMPDYLIMHQDSAFILPVINYLFRNLGIKIKTLAPNNHQSLQAEHGIMFLATILTKHLIGLGQY